MRPWQRAVRAVGPLRVMFVVPDLGVGGAEQHVATLAPALDADRFRVSVVCIGEEGALFEGVARTHVRVRALRSRRHPWRALRGLVATMRRERPDVVITRGYNAETLGRIAAVLARVPRTVVWVHNATSIVARGRVRPLVDRVLDPLTDAYYGVAHGQRPYLVDELRYPAEKIRIIHNGVDPDVFAPMDPAGRAAVAAELGLPPSAPTIGIVAMLRPEKDHRTLLHATQMLLEEIPDARLLVVGDGPLRGELENLATTLGIGGNVVFAGARPDVGRLLPVLDVFVLSSYTECFPLSVLEAMACGVPVVGTAVGGVPEMIENGVTGHVVPARDARAMADALVKTLQDARRAGSMGRAARHRVESQFTLEHSVRAAEAALAGTAGLRTPDRPLSLSIVLDQTAIGGAEMLLLELCRHVDRAVVAPRLICLRKPGPLGADFTDTVPVQVLGRTGRFDTSTVPRLVRALRAARTDIVLVTHHNRAALTLGRVAARLARVPATVVAAHDMDLTSVGGRVLPRHVVETLFLSQALVLLAPSQGRYLHDEEGVGRFPWRRAPEVVIPNGIVLPPPPTPDRRAGARARLGLRDDEVVLGIVARLSAQKAHHVLLQAVAALEPGPRPIRLVIVGGGAEEPRLRALAAELGIAERTLFTGVRDDVREILPAFDVSCLSSVHEGAPLVVLESMSAGVPMVATDCGALRDLVDDGGDGFLVPVGDPAALAARLARLVDDPQLRADMGARARARAEREYSIERTVQGFQHLFTGLVPR